MILFSNYVAHACMEIKQFKKALGLIKLNEIEDKTSSQ